jgi:hopanoid biosynthesis associated RND transporter like protein HpnN
MHSSGNGPLTRTLTRWTLFVQKNAFAVIALFAILTATAAWLAVTRLEVDGDPSSLIAPDVPWHKAEEAYAVAFPDQQKTIVAVIEGNGPEQADTALNTLLKALRDKPEFSRVWSIGTGPFFEKNALLYLEPDQLDALSTDLETAQPFLGHLSNDPSLGGMFQLLGLALSQPGAELPFDLSQITGPVSKTVDAATQGRSLPLSWQSLVAGKLDLTGDGKRFLLLKLANPLEDRAAVKVVRDTVRQLQLDADHGIKVRLTGEVPMWLDEMDAAFDGAIASAVASLMIAAGFLYMGLRSGRLVVVCLISLISGLLLTAGFAVLAIGRLNLISVAFATLYIAIAIDYGVQFGMRYRELMANGLSSHDALTETGGKFGEALLLCALSTSVGFFAFVPTDYRGVAELGVVAGVGILIGVATSLSLLIALIEKWPTRDTAPKTLPVPASLKALADWPMRRPTQVRIIAIALTLAGLASLYWLRFDYNPMHLRPKNTESLQVFEELMAGPNPPLTATVLVKTPEEAEQMAAKLQALPSVKQVLTLNSFVPTQQDEKLATLESLSLSLGLSIPEHLELKPADPVRDIAAIQNLRTLARNFKGDDKSAANMKQLADSLDAWLKVNESATADARIRNLTLLRDALLGSMPQLLQRLHQALNAGPVTVQDLPDDIRREWVSDNGLYKVEASPKENISEDEPLKRFAADVTSVTPYATGAPVADVAGARTVIGAFVQAFASAFVLIVILLLILLRSVADTLRALVPLVMGSLLLTTVCVLIGLKMNFANVIALPLLLGIGVDIGIVILWRARHATPGDGNPVMTATGAAVAISAITTLISFASLMLSAHRGMFSMGLLLTLGLLLYLVCTFLVLPSILTRPQPTKTS